MKSRSDRFKAYIYNEAPKLVFITLWVAANLTVFLERYLHYDKIDSTKNGIIRSFLGVTLPLARGSAANIKLNCAILLLLVLRNFLSWLRGTWAGNVIPIDKNIIFHRNVAWMMMLASTIHTVSHFINYQKISAANAVERVILYELGLISLGPDGKPQSPSVFYNSYASVPGYTGHAIILCMLFMYSSSMFAVRSRMFEVFWYSHHLFIPFYLLGCLHGIMAIFQPPDFYLWVVGPLVLYLVERGIRLLRAKQNCIILQAIAHPSNVIELRMKKTVFKYVSGQYVFVQIPFIANYEWHPFTISSSPDEEFISIHIRKAGDWTTDLMELFNPDKKMGVVQENMVNAPNGRPIIQIDGPFGAASEEVFKFKYVLLWAAGIGVTPFASILKQIKYQISKNETKISTVEFYWISRDMRCFEWFIDLLKNLENTCDFLTIHLFFTGSSQKEADGTAGSEESVLSGLKSQTHYGRPDIKAIFRQKAEEYRGCKVGVFFCGPPIVSKELYSACGSFSNFEKKTFFKYHKENF